MGLKSTSEWHASGSHATHCRPTHARATHASHATLSLHGHHHELHLLLLHVFAHLGVLIDFVREESGLEIVLIDRVVHLDPVVGDSTDQHWHKHWVSSYLAGVLALEEIEGVVIGCLY